MSEDTSMARAEELSPEEVREKFGVNFEAANHRRDLEHWREASPADHGRVLAELMRYGETVSRSTGIEKPPSPAVRDLISARRRAH